MDSFSLPSLRMLQLFFSDFRDSFLLHFKRPQVHPDLHQVMFFKS